MIAKGDKKHVKCIYLMHMRNLFLLYVLFTTIYWLSERKRIVLTHFYNCSKAISLAPFIQIIFIYKWHSRNFYVSFLAYDVTIQYDRGDYSGVLILAKDIYMYYTLQKVVSQNWYST